MVPSPTLTTTITLSPTSNVIENEVVELDRPVGRKAAKETRKAQGRQADEVIQLRKMKYTLLEESRIQEKEFYRLKAEKMEYDKEKEEKKFHQENETLKLEAEKFELVKKESDQRIMMMDLNVLPEMQRLYVRETSKRNRDET